MPKPLSCIIIDDEPMASMLLEQYIGRFPDELALIGVYHNPIQAIDIIKTNKPELLFLDIQMPEMSGLEVLDILHTDRPLVILTTSSASYALKSYEYDVIDYLLKPIAFDKFVTAIKKVQRRVLGNDTTAENDELKWFFVKVDKITHRLRFEDIIYIEALKDYVKIYLLNYDKKFMVTRQTMNVIESQLPGDTFLRIHRSYIVNILYFKYLEGHQIILHNDTALPIGNTHKEEVKNKIKENSLSK